MYQYGFYARQHGDVVTTAEIYGSVYIYRDSTIN